MPKSPPGLQELPHLLEQESEGLWYIFAVAFRLLGVRWPRSSYLDFSDAGATTAVAAAADETAGSDAFDGDDGLSLMPWPERRSFEQEAAVAPDDGARAGEPGGRYRQISHHHHQQQQQQQQQNRRLRPPRPGSAEAGGAGGRPSRGGSGVGGNGGGALPGPMLVVDDLLDWSGDGDEGPAGGGGGVQWDGAGLGLEFLRSEGRALLARYFVADGEVQRAR